MLIRGAGPLSASGVAQSRVASPVTFSRDIAPLLFDRCASCHHPDGAAPFSLLTYQDARSRATLIAAVTRSRLMPPWKSEPGVGEFIGHRHLSDADIDAIAKWVATGAPEGDPHDLPAPPKWTQGWQLGTPDLVVPFAEPFTVRADGPDFSRTFVLKAAVDRTRYVRGLEFRPGTAAVVHHANIRIDRTTASRRLDDEDPGPGYDGLLLSSAVFPDGHFLGWTPGQNAPLLPKGLSWTLTPGTDLVIQIHFVPDGRTEVVTPSIGLFFTDDPPERTPTMLRLGRESIEIPAGTRNYISTDRFELPVDVSIEALQPHAHYRARQVTGTATRPDGTVIPLISIKDWDYRWQHVYRLVTPIALPKGTVLSLQYTFDNSDENPRNPFHPPRPVHWGQQSSDEMGDLWIQMLTRRATDLRVLNQAIQVKHISEEIVGYETMIRAEPTKISLRNDVAERYAALGKSDDAVVHLDIVARLQPSSAAAHYNLGTALAAAGRTSEAAMEFRVALGINPNYSMAHNNLGQTLLARGNVVDALSRFREAARLDPSNASAHYNIAAVERAQGNLAEAVEHLRHVVRLWPEATQPAAELAWVLATAPDKVGDAAEAVALAERAVAIDGGRDPRLLDVLAAAQAANGRFDLAVANCEAALRLGPPPGLADAIRARLVLYRRQEPVRSIAR